MPAAIFASVLAVAGATTSDLSSARGLDVLEPAAVGLPGALLFEDGRARDGGEGERHHEALGGLGGDHDGGEPVLDQQTHQLDRFVHGDAAGDADQHGALALVHALASRRPMSLTSPSPVAAPLRRSVPV